MIIVALLYLLSLSALVTGFIAAPNHTINGRGWLLVVLVFACSGLTLAVGVLS